MNKRIFLFAFLLLAGICQFSAKSIAQCPLISSTGLNEVCAGSTITLTLTGGGGNALESWVSGSGAIATVTGGVAGSGTAVVTGVAPGTVAIQYKIGGTTVCAMTVSVRATPPVPTITGTTSVCAGSTTALGGSPGSGNWSVDPSGSGIASINSSGVVTGIAQGTTTVTYRLTSIYGCTTFATTTIIVDDVPVISGRSSTWVNRTIALTQSSTPAGTWTSSNTAVGTVDATTGVVQGWSVGLTTIKYTVTNSCGVVFGTKTVSVNPYSVTPSASPTNWEALPTTTVNALNTAMLEPSSTGMPGQGTLFAYATWDGGTSGKVELSQLGITNVAAQISLTGMTGTPDIVLANYDLGDKDKYVLAVAYPTSSGVVVDCYDFYMTGLGFAGLGTSPTFTYTYSCVPQTVHMDVVAMITNTVTTGMPYCQKAVVTWDDAGIVYAAEIDLQVGGGGTIGGVTTIGSGKDPDVAGITRIVGTSIHMGLVTCVSTSNDQLYYYEWPVGGSASAVTILESVLTPNTLSKPRIDANDNENTNATSSGNPYYKIAAQAYNNSTGYNEVHTYDNLLAAGASYYASSNIVNFVTPTPTAIPAGYHDSYGPTVAFSGIWSSPGAYDGTAYIITHFTRRAAGEDVEIMEPIAFGSSTDLASPNDYFWISETGSNVSFSPGDKFASSSSAASNFISIGNLVAWAYDDGSLGTKIEYKLSPCCYAFKEAGLATTSATVNEEWTAYPNPSNGYLVISGVKEGDRYCLTDMAGRAQMQGTLAGKSQELNINRLAKGSYMLQLYGAEGAHKTRMIVKQ